LKNFFILVENQRIDMHEFALMENVIRIVRRAAQENRLEKVTGIFLVVGQRSGVNVDALRFAFEVLQKEESWLVDAALIVEEKAALGSCPQCHATVPIWHFDLQCSECGFLPVQATSGEEFYVASIEGDRTGG
jgi:hydrogenase nickel incorporation protein HypA/HybF